MEYMETSEGQLPKMGKKNFLAWAWVRYIYSSSGKYNSHIKAQEHSLSR